MSVFETNEAEAFEAQELNELFEAESEAYETGEYESELNELFESEAYETGEYESENFLGGIVGNLFGETSNEVMSEMQEAELASELLEIQSEEELEEFLGKLFKGVAKGVGGFMKSGTGRALGGILKNVAKKALPIAGSALGNLVVPGLGGAIGGKLGSLASGLFEIPELNEMSQQEAEFEVAKRYVRLASTAARNAAIAPPNAPSRAVAKAAVVSAARRHAPGLVAGTRYAPGTRLRGPDGRFASARRPVPATRRRAGYRPSTAFAARGATPPRRGTGYAGGYVPTTTVVGGAYAATPYAPTPSYAPSYSSTVYDDGNGYDGRPQTGRWVRRGRKIIILGA